MWMYKLRINIEKRSISMRFYFKFLLDIIESLFRLEKALMFPLAWRHIQDFVLRTITVSSNSIRSTAVANSGTLVTSITFTCFLGAYIPAVFINKLPIAGVGFDIRNFLLKSLLFRPGYDSQFISRKIRGNKYLGLHICV